MKKVIDFTKFRRAGTDRFRNKKFEYASTEMVDRFDEIRSEFLEDIFELSDGDYIVSDESLLSDMVMDFTEEEIRNRIIEKYGINIEDVGNTLFCDIFSRIHQNKKST